MKKYIIACITVVLCLFCVVFTAYAETPADEQTAFCSLGDVNGDNTVTSVDARLALRAAAKLQTLEEGPFSRADIADRDGVVNASDARHILRIAAQLEARPKHQINVIPGKAATCTEDGISEGKTVLSAVKSLWHRKLFPQQVIRKRCLRKRLQHVLKKV